MKRKLGLVNISGAINDKDWGLCLEFLEKEKLDFFYSPLVRQKNFFFAGSVEEKQQQLTDTLVQTKLLFAIRGGSGLVHLLDFFASCWSKKNSFSIIGFSDISILQNYLATRFGQVSMHSFVLNNLRLAKKKDKDFFWRRLQGDWQGELAGEDRKDLVWFGNQRAEAKILGGNLACLVSLLGTPYQIPLDGAILFLEDIAEPYYRIERFFSQLYYAQCLQKISGLILGYFLWEDKKLDTQKILQLVKDFLPYNIPIICNFPAGHGKKNAPLPIGAKVILDAKKKKFFVAEKIML